MITVSCRAIVNVEHQTIRIVIAQVGHTLLYLVPTLATCIMPPATRPNAGTRYRTTSVPSRAQSYTHPIPSQFLPCTVCTYKLYLHTYKSFTLHTSLM